MCISWTVKCLISLMHGVTMKSYWKDLLHFIDMFRYRKKSDRGEATILLDDLHALWCASPLYIAKYLSKRRSVNGNTRKNKIQHSSCLHALSISLAGLHVV